jgi:hypothetical protein
MASNPGFAKDGDQHILFIAIKQGAENRCNQYDQEQQG